MAPRKKKTAAAAKALPTSDKISEQVLKGDSFTIAEARAFIEGAQKSCRKDWLNIADRSWNEIKKRNKRGKLHGGDDLDRARRWTKFPLWWSCFQIRRPITLARLPIPVLKDTQGDDPLGRTACVIGERLTRGILKTFDAFEEFQAANDDSLITDFGWGRVYYRMKECVEEEKLRLQVIEPQPQELPAELGPDGEPLEMQGPPPPPLQPIYLTPDGEQVDNPLFDDLGPYVKTGELVEVDHEEVYWEAGLYSNFYIDDVNRFPKTTRVAFEYEYSYREFKEKFGKEALEKIPALEVREHEGGKPVRVFEMHDKMLREVRYWTENSEDFIQPKGMTDPQVLKETGEYDNSDLYGLSGFFPCTAPLVFNAPTDEFWPTPEYFQVADILDDTNSIVHRMVLLTKAIRIRFFFDSSVPLLKQLIGETGEGGGLGIPNLEQSLMSANGKLTNLVAYFPVDEMIKGLTQMYTAFEQRLNMFYQVTGISELLRGQTSDGDKTYGERQLEGKFALNRIEPRQRRVQEWIKDQYQLLMELALKMFSDKTLDDYITPQTLDAEDKERYVAALDLLRQNKRSRFRMDFETDSTIAINEMWKKQQAIELANVLTKAMESTAKVAETQPELAETELKVLSHLIGEFSDGKLFIDEIQDSIKKVIEKSLAPKPDQGPDIEMEKLKLEGARFNFETQKQSVEDSFRQLEIESRERIEMAKVARDDRLANLEAQINQYKIQGEQALKNTEIMGKFEQSKAELEKAYQEISANITLEQQKLALQRDELLVELRKVADKKEVDQFALMLDERVANFEAQFKAAQIELDKTKSTLDLQERFLTEQRLQAEHQMDLVNQKFEGVNKTLDLVIKSKQAIEAPEIEAPEIPKATKAKEKKKSSKEA